MHSVIGDRGSARNHGGRRIVRCNAHRAVAAVALCLLLILASHTALAAKCLFISSYHQGYAWSDGVERGLRATLRGKCEIRQFDMDTKRHKDAADQQAKGLEAKRLIDSWRPDVVITADDNAAKYVIQPYYRDHPTPFVFCGVNWTVDEYGFPYSNVTGMIEIAPIRPLLDQVKALQAHFGRAIYLGANTHTESKNLARFQRAAEKAGIELHHRLVDTADEWIAAYRDAQAYDFVIMGSNSGIRNWDEQAVVAAILPETRRLSVTNHEWMMPYAMLGFTKVPEEQGEWAGAAALSIIAGVKPSEIPIVPNHKWDIWSNPVLLSVAGIDLPDTLRDKAKTLPR